MNPDIPVNTKRKPTQLLLSRLRYPFALFIFCNLLSACMPCPDDMPPPLEIQFRVIDHNGHTPLDSANLYWYLNGVKVNDNDAPYDRPPFQLLYPGIEYDTVRHLSKADSSRPYFSSYDLIQIATQYNISRFYIEYPNRKTDTLDIEVVRVETGSRRCPGYHYDVSSVRHNGVVVEKDTSYIKWQEVYPLDRY